MKRHSLVKAFPYVGSLTPVFTALAVSLGTAACSRVPVREPEVAELQQVLDSGPPRWSGMTNIFFDSIPSRIRDSVRLGHGWTAIQLADVVQGEGLVTIYSARFKPPSTPEVRYV